MAAIILVSGAHDSIMLLDIIFLIHFPVPQLAPTLPSRPHASLFPLPASEFPYFPTPCLPHYPTSLPLPIHPPFVFSYRLFSTIFSFIIPRGFDCSLSNSFPHLFLSFLYTLLTPQYFSKHTTYKFLVLGLYIFYTYLLAYMATLPTCVKTDMHITYVRIGVNMCLAFVCITVYVLTVYVLSLVM